jgi:chaperonin GroEL
MLQFGAFRYFGPFVASKVSEAAPTIGFDVVTGKYVDMVKAGILDPTLSVCAALRSAASISSLLVTTEVIVTNFVEADHDPYVLSSAD